MHNYAIATSTHFCTTATQLLERPLLLNRNTGTSTQLLHNCNTNTGTSTHFCTIATQLRTPTFAQLKHSYLHPLLTNFTTATSTYLCTTLLQLLTPTFAQPQHSYLHPLLHNFTTATCTHFRTVILQVLANTFAQLQHSYYNRGQYQLRQMDITRFLRMPCRKGSKLFISLFLF